MVQQHFAFGKHKSLPILRVLSILRLVGRQPVFEAADCHALAPNSDKFVACSSGKCKRPLALTKIRPRPCSVKGFAKPAELLRGEQKVGARSLCGHVPDASRGERGATGAIPRSGHPEPTEPSARSGRSCPCEPLLGELDCPSSRGGRSRMSACGDRGDAMTALDDAPSGPSRTTELPQPPAGANMTGVNAAWTSTSSGAVGLSRPRTTLASG